MKAIRDLQGANYLTIAGQEVVDIQFYAEGSILESCNMGKGWFGDNHQTCAEVANMDIVSRRSVDTGMRNGGAFYISKTGTLYLDADDFELFEYLGELVAVSGKEETYYGNFFQVTMTLDGIKDTYRFMTRGYTRVVKTGRASSEEQLVKMLKGVLNDKHSIAEFLSKNPKAVIEALQGSIDAGVDK